MLKDTNIAIFFLVPGFKKYSAYCQETQIIANKLIIDNESLIVPINLKQQSNQNQIQLNIDVFNERIEIPLSIFDDTIISKNEAEMLQYHQNFDHVPFTKIQLIAKQGIILVKYTKYKIPVCSA